MRRIIPLTIANALAGMRLPVYGKGENREWTDAIRSGAYRDGL